ncbi:MAG: hypothetical protein KIT72_01745 [Polyangiaceae bacterium]|nr:hypothetical protein [Polyangiaceae bacterium]MCW5789121.1 hypothetical protein [Polyangiaceae bacterium]
MELNADADIPFDRARVFRAYRDELPKLVEFLPNIRRIDVVSREEPEPGVVEISNVWHGGGELPSAARVVLSDSMLGWRDQARWSEADYTCSWSIRTNSFTEAVRCEGVNRFVETEAGTRFEIRGVIEIDASKIAGVPKLLRSGINKTVTEYVCRKVTPNLIEVSRGLTRYLERQAKTSLATLS